jgi:hypothetical protein
VLRDRLTQLYSELADKNNSIKELEERIGTVTEELER